MPYLIVLSAKITHSKTHQYATDQACPCGTRADVDKSRLESGTTSSTVRPLARPLPASMLGWEEFSQRSPSPPTPGREWQAGVPTPTTPGRVLVVLFPRGKSRGLDVMELESRGNCWMVNGDRCEKVVPN
ncbi:unnamed protein product [Phyllotreta striolata]|uniref:Uncharacterized protein n=1 Tax=Phyllotreta striolata TaxID=444603 RepID=A0A9N9TWV1_PHYSR|nr:unnamed protein product [Phyllotreta striolata]